MRSACRSRSSRWSTRRHRPHRRRRQDLGLAPDLRLRQGGRAGRPRPAPADPAPRQCRRPTPRCRSTARRSTVRDGGERAASTRSRQRSTARLLGEGTFDPPTTPLDAEGQGMPYATYGFARADRRARGRYRARHGEGAAHRRPRTMSARRSTRLLVEGQIEGGIAQGLGLALMEEYLPGRTENLHDYLIPTIGDVPRDRVHPDRGPRPAGPVRRQGRRRAWAGPDGAGDPRRHPPRDRRARASRAGAAAPAARGDPRAGEATP